VRFVRLAAALLGAGVLGGCGAFIAIAGVIAFGIAPSLVTGLAGPGNRSAGRADRRAGPSGP